MSILNQSITPHGHGQPTFPTKASNSQDIFQQLPIFKNRSHSLKKITSAAATGSSAQGSNEHQKQNSISESIGKCSELLNKEGLLGPITWPMEPFTLSFLPSFMENEKFINGIEEPRRLFCLEPPSATTLVVAVSSAVKLKHKQLDQIARKMERVTGFTSVRLENSVDPSLIAGFIISYEEEEGPHVIDLSVKGQLAELAARIQSAD